MIGRSIRAAIAVSLAVLLSTGFYLSWIDLDAKMKSYYAPGYTTFGRFVSVDPMEYTYPSFRGNFFELFLRPMVVTNKTNVIVSLRLGPEQCLHLNGSCGSFPFFIGNASLIPTPVQVHLGKVIHAGETINLTLKLAGPIFPGAGPTLKVAVFSTYTWCGADLDCETRLGQGKTLELNLSPYT